jgi:ABC-type dipeptide/oligopeptide/nickel transport system permease subunit
MDKKKNKFLSNKGFVLFGILALIIILIAIFAPVLAHGIDPTAGSLADAIMPPDAKHIFGTDKMGRDIYARVLYGARISLFSTFILVAVIYIGQQVFDGLFVNDNVSNLTHIVGGIVGTILGYSMNKGGVKKA